MKNILTVTDKASYQLEKIIQSAPSDTIGLLVELIKLDAMDMHTN